MSQNADIDLGERAAWEFALPEELIAASPPPERPASRLLVADPASGSLHDSTFARIGDWLRAGDLLVVNDTRVRNVRFDLRRTTGAALEALVVGFGSEGDWSNPVRPLVAMVRGSGRLHPGEKLHAADGSLVEYAGPSGDGLVLLHLEDSDADAFLARVGRLPLPPYIVRRRRELGVAAHASSDEERYQTVYAREAGSVAAPTAGLHFDDALLRSLAASGVELARVTLHVGIGTFKPVTGDRIDAHVMHAERYAVTDETAAAIARARANGGRVVAVGTTVVRTLESAARADGTVAAGTGETSLFIRPGFDFRVVDALITNFHLPGSTLLALVAAFAGYDLTRQAYAHAIESRYRFFSYGDAMFIPGRA